MHVRAAELTIGSAAAGRRACVGSAPEKARSNADGIAKAASPLPLPKTASEPRIDYRFENRTLTLDDFLARERITGLLMIRDGEILLERYQYDRTPAHRFAEADATWVRSRDGLEIASGSFNAILRDYGRLGVLLANDGAVGDKQVVPKTICSKRPIGKRQRRKRAAGCGARRGLARIDP
jgi:hypothetical protein